ncbi:glutaredoxin domain-containing cysteine-rich protein 2-like [Sinocyclocheilus grahami]|uniref:glutaredoxin domain-containing cysteine-rich protein 2-like n=1 Tax=Sinocyclocheilus grahami TaxID=75366 RepID=UPI0007AC556D|nr:PREDICTED: glutaredoxin domain-containing cysteine-rich protein 2-like [Sinocyclocheilus grahami]
MDGSGGKDVEAKPTGNEKMELPVLTQPGLGVTTTTVTTITQTGGDWSTGLFDVCADTSTFLMGAFVPCCLDLSLAHQYGECMCLPLLPGSTFAMRAGIRERFKIRAPVLDFGKIIIYTSNLKIIQAPHRRGEYGRSPHRIRDRKESSPGRESRSKGRHRSARSRTEEPDAMTEQKQEAGSCEQCGGSGCAPCSLCHGSKLSMLANRFNESIRELRCPACNPHGLQRCQSCTH